MPALSWSVLFLVLAAAALHAGWNTAVKRAGSAERATARICVGGILIALATLPFIPWPAAAAWPYLAGSVAVHIAYFALTAAVYARADLSIAYPMMRGGGVMVTALLAPFIFDDPLPWPGLVGIGFVGLALTGLAFGGGRSAFGARGLPFVLANALAIGAYSLLDGLGARASGAPLSYTILVFSLGAFGNLALIAGRDGIASLRPLLGPRDLSLAVLGGACCIGSYALVLTAMTLAPVALIAALRETSMLFAAGFAAVILHEKVGRRRLAAALLVAAGAVAIKLT